MVTSKRQLSFYAETDVDLYLSLVGPGSKTAILNEAIRSRIITDASVDLNDGRRPQPFAALTEHEMSEVHSNLILEELSLNNVDDHVWEIVRETANNSWKQNTARYLALHQAKFKEPFKINRVRSREECDEYMRRGSPPSAGGATINALRKPNLYIKFSKSVWEQPDPKLLNELYTLIGNNTWLPDEHDTTEGPYVRVHVPEVNARLQKLLSNSLNVFEWDEKGLYRFCMEHTNDSSYELPASEKLKSNCNVCGKPALWIY